MRYNISIETNEEQFYLRYFVTNNSYKEDIYVNEKDEVVEISKEDKEKWFKKSGSSKKQIEAGISEEKDVKPRNLKIENLAYFQKGAKVCNYLTKKQMNLLSLEYVD